MAETYRFDHSFGCFVAHWHIVHLVLVTQVTHHVIRGVKHLPKVREKAETPANVK